jgi:hypothetical protein
MYIGTDCGFEIHRAKKVDLSGVVGNFLCVVTLANPDPARAVVHLEPQIASRMLGDTLASRMLGDTLERYLMEKRSLDGWDTLFRGIQATEEDEGVTAGVIRNLTKRVDGRGGQEKYGVTPHKKRPKLEIRSPALEANYELTMPEVEASLGDNPEDIIRNLSTEWRVMAANVNTLKEMVNGCRDVMREKSEATVEEFGDLDFEVARLANLVGARPEDMDPVPILKALGGLSNDIAELQSKTFGTGTGSTGLDESMLKRAIGLVKEFDRAKITIGDIESVKKFVDEFEGSAGAGKSLREKMGQEVLTSFQPVLDLFAKLSSSKAAPGDVLEQELAAIRVSLTAVQSTLASGQIASTGPGPTPGPPGFSSGLGSMSLGVTGQGAPIAPATEAASADAGAFSVTLLDLEDRVKSIEDQLRSKTVVMGGLTFKSQMLTRAWLGVNGPAVGAFIYFLDAHSLLSLAADEAGSARSVISFQHSAAKGGYSSTEEAMISASFKIELPAIFGADSTSMHVTADTRALPAMKTAEAWDPENGYTGGRLRFEALIKESKETMMGSVGDHLVGMGKKLWPSNASSRRISF